MARPPPPSVNAAIDDPTVDAGGDRLGYTNARRPADPSRTRRARQCSARSRSISDLPWVDRRWVEIAALNPTVMVGFNRRFDPRFT